MTNYKAQKILDFLNISEGIKNELRHSWTSKGRRESVAEHSWRLSLMVLVCAPYFPKEFNVLKAIKMAILHDIGEVYEGDLHFLEINKSENSRKKRFLAEENAVHNICKVIGNHGSSIFNIWREFEENKTIEAQIVNCLDKLEACIQHNQADISTWTKEEKESIDNYFSQINPIFNIIQNLKELVYSECLAKTNLSFI